MWPPDVIGWMSADRGACEDTHHGPSTSGPTPEIETYLISKGVTIELVPGADCD